MRIAQLVESLDVGGLERMAVDLALAQRAAGHWVTVYCFFGADPLRAELDAAGIPVVELHKEPHSPKLVWRLAHQLKRDGIEVLHGHNPGVHHAAALAKAAAGVPVCLNTRHSATTSQGNPYQERYFRLAGPLTDHVVFVCEYVRRELEPRLRYPTGKCSVILNGIATEKFLARPSTPGGTPPRLRFGTLGRIVPAKGHEVLIDAFAKIAGRLPHAELEIYGSGPLRDEMQARITATGMDGRIRLAGRTTDSASVLQSFDIFVLSSVQEGLPLVILEAMAAGLPIVSTRIGGVSEVAPEGRVARYCRPGDADSLAAALLDAALDPGLAETGRAGRALAAAHYDISRMSDRYFALYRRLLDRQAGDEPRRVSTETW
jgi:glycosyltransferase involved in cell wall biosynthesis